MRGLESREADEISQVQVEARGHKNEKEGRTKRVLKEVHKDQKAPDPTRLSINEKPSLRW
jgi:hypothetical protein